MRKLFQFMEKNIVIMRIIYHYTVTRKLSHSEKTIVMIKPSHYNEKTIVLMIKLFNYSEKILL